MTSRISPVRQGNLQGTPGTSGQQGELLDVIAASAGVRSYHRAMGLPMPQLPPPEDQNETLGLMRQGAGRR